MKNIKKFFLNAALLCGVSMLMRTVSVSFNVYVSNKAGAEAMGLYSLLSGIYGFALTFATSGINLATMRLVAGALGRNNRQEALAALKKCITYALIFSSVATAALFFGAPFMGERFLHDARTVLSLKILAASLIPISLSSTLNGYFTAVRRVYKNAVIQVCEQAIKIFSISLLLTLLLPKGIEFACAALALGGAISECASFIISLITFIADKSKHIGKNIGSYTNATLTSELLKTALPIASSAYVRSGLISIEHMLIPIGLQKSGLNKGGALALYGIIQSMVLPIVLFPAALISSFSGLLVPELTECAVKDNKRQIRYICERSLQMALIFSIGTAGLIIFFSNDLGRLIYPNESTSSYIKMLAPLIPIMYLDTTVDHMLKGLGEQLYSMAVNIADSALSVFLVWFLLPKMGITGYIVTIYVTELINASFSIIRLMKKSDFKTQLIKWVIKPLLCIIGSTCICHMVFGNLNVPGGIRAAELVFRMLFTTAVYALLLIATNAFDKEDVRWAANIFKGKINRI